MPPKTRLITSHTLLLPNVTAEAPETIEVHTSSSSSSSKSKKRAVRVPRNIEEEKHGGCVRKNNDPSTNPINKFALDPKLQDTGSVTGPPIK
jgi:hypothetical protein